MHSEVDTALGICFPVSKCKAKGSRPVSVRWVTHVLQTGMLAPEVTGRTGFQIQPCLIPVLALGHWVPPSLMFQQILGRYTLAHSPFIKPYVRPK